MNDKRVTNNKLLAWGNCNFCIVKILDVLPNNFFPGY